MLVPLTRIKKAVKHKSHPDKGCIQSIKTVSAFSIPMSKENQFHLATSYVHAPPSVLIEH